MGYYKKEVYDKKREWAAKKMERNSEVGQEHGLTEEQCNALEQICSLRHEFHCNSERYWSAEQRYARNAEIWNFVYYEFDEDRNCIANQLLARVGLPIIEDLPSDDDIPSDDDYYEYLTDSEKEPWERIAEEKGYFSGYNAWLEETDYYSEYCHRMEDINNRIEKYLYDIDQKYGTSYSPSGATRI